MKFKSFLKIGLPIFSVAALAVALPVALTSCSDNKSSKDKTKTVSTTTQDINNATKNLGDLSVETLASKSDAVKDQNVFDTLVSSLKINKDDILTVNYVKQASPSSGGASAQTYAAKQDEDVQEETQSQTTNKWNIIVTLKDNRKWNQDLIKKEVASQNASFTINGQTLTINNVQTKFSIIGISEKKLSDSSKKIADALNEIKDLANYVPNSQQGASKVGSGESEQAKELVANFVEKEPSIPLSALTAKLENGATSTEGNGVSKQDNNTNLSVTNSKVKVTLSASENFVLFDDKNAVVSPYSQTIDYSFIDIDSLANSIVDFIKTQDIKLNKNGTTQNLKVTNGKETVNLPVQYSVINPFTQATKLGNNGTYVVNFGFDFSKFGFKDDKLAETIKTSLQSYFGSSVKFTSNSPISVEFDENTNKLNVGVVSNVFAIDKSSIVNGVNYLASFTKDQLSKIDNDAQIRVGLLQAMNMYELMSPNANFIKVALQQNSKEANTDTTSIVVTLGQSQKGQSISDGAMVTLSKQLQSELTTNKTLGLKSVDSIIFNEATTAEKTTTPATLTINLKNSGLAQKENTNKVTSEGVKKLSNWLVTMNKDTFSTSQFNTFLTSSSSDPVNLALENSTIQNEVIKDLGLNSSQLYQVRFIADKSGKTLKVVVILNSGFSFDNNITGEIETTSKTIKVDAQTSSTFEGNGMLDTLTLTLSAKQASSEVGK